MVVGYMKFDFREKPSYQWAIWKLFCTHRLIIQIDIEVDIVSLFCTKHLKFYDIVGKITLIRFIHKRKTFYGSFDGYAEFGISFKSMCIILVDPMLLNDLRARILIDVDNMNVSFIGCVTTYEANNIVYTARKR